MRLQTRCVETQPSWNFSKIQINCYYLSESESAVKTLCWQFWWLTCLVYLGNYCFFINIPSAFVHGHVCLFSCSVRQLAGLGTSWLVDDCQTWEAILERLKAFVWKDNFVLSLDSILWLTCRGSCSMWARHHKMHLALAFLKVQKAALNEVCL